MNLPTLTDQSLAPPGEHTIVVFTPIPYDVGASWRREKAHYVELLADVLESVIPGVHDHLTFSEGASPRTMERYTLNLTGALLQLGAGGKQWGEHRDAALIFGAPECVSGGIANSAFCVDEQGTVAAVYRKVQLYGGEESDAFVAGDELLVVDLCGLKMGLMICFDIEFPEVARVLARAGAEMFVTISANMEPFGNDHAVFLSARALENGLPHAYVNQVGPGEKNLTFVGGSTVVSPDGEIYAQADSGRGLPSESRVSASGSLPASRHPGVTGFMS